RIAPLRGVRPWRRAPPGHRRGRPALAAGDRSAARPDDPDPPAHPRLALTSRWGTLEVRSSARLDLIDIPDRVAAALVLFTPHATAALLLNEHEEHLLGDIRAWLGRAVPEEASYAHNRIDHNADSHPPAIMLGSSLVVRVEEGRLALGRWQRIFFVDLDGPRARQVRFRLLALGRRTHHTRQLAH